MKADKSEEFEQPEGKGQQSAPARKPSFLTGLNNRPDREQVIMAAEARLFQQPQHAVIVKNISIGGFCVERAEGVPVGAQMVLEVEGIGQFPAIVRWTHDGKFGARFNGRLGDREKEAIATLVRSSRKGDQSQSSDSSGS